MEIVVPPDYRHLWVTDSRHPVLKVPDPALREVAKTVRKVTPRHRVLVENMVKVMRQADGIGLAATQLGIMERIIVVCPDTKPLALINPVITSQEGEEDGEEGCLSLPALYGTVTRAQKITVNGLDRKGAAVCIEAEGTAARVLQHEIDHLDGILFIDKADPATLYWSEPSGKDSG
ncbi:MAG: peptide deformylase [Fimbriimonadaceae bacterium]|nr:peptide deformylase [Fimbriimonadaceae bacterium]